MSNFEKESFSIEFDGPAFELHEISASSLAQSLLALDALSRQASKALYGKDTETEVKVKIGRVGSYVVDLIIQNPIESIAGITTIGGGVYAVIKGVVALTKWAQGKKVRVEEEKENSSVIENEYGETKTVNSVVVNIYNSNNTQIQLSRLTQTLDNDGAESIKIFEDWEHGDCETITKEERKYFRHETGEVLTDNAAEVLLKILNVSIIGASKGWRFSEGEDGVEFAATVEDEEFLKAVKEKKVLLENGAWIRAVLRTVQQKVVRTRADRSIIEVKEVFYPKEE